MVLERQPKRKTLATQLNKTVEIQEVQSVSDGEGGFTDTWVKLADVWAGISPIRADQRAQYASLNVHATHLVRVRGYTEIKEENRIVWDSRIFEVLTVEDIQEKGFLKVCTCLERR